jgi:regulatory associated protein of mTOR
MCHNNRATAVAPVSYKNCIQLAACAENQILPMNAELPADLFTACLTTPIKIALKWYELQPNFLANILTIFYL